MAAREAVLDRLQWQLADLRASLDRCARRMRQWRRNSIKRE
jgi:hypothetical protein